MAVGRARTWLLTGNSPVKIGIIISLIGLGFLLREAAVRGWVEFTIEMRLGAAAAFGLALLAVGWRQRAKRPVYGVSLQGGGIAVLYLVTLASYAVYDLLADPVALVAVVLITVAAGALAMLQNALTLAMLGLIGGFSAPLLAFEWPRDHLAVFSFYAVLGVAVVAMSRRKAWPTLVLSGYLFTFAVAGLWLFAKEDHSDWAQLQPFIAFFVLLYALVPSVWPPVSRGRSEPIGFGEVWTGPLVFCTPFAGLAMQALLVGHLRYGTAISSVVLSAVHVAFLLLSRRRKVANRQIEVAYTALAVVFSATAVPLFLGASATSAVWAVQGAVLVWASSRWGSRLSLLGGAVLQAAAALSYVVRLSNESAHWDTPAVFGFWAEATPVVNAYALGAIMLAACGLASAESLRRSTHFEAWQPRLQIAALVWGAGWFLFAETAAVWLQLGMLPAVALWAVQGAALVWLASQRRQLPAAVVGVAMQVTASLAVITRLNDDAGRLSRGSFGFWADTLPVVNRYFGVTLLLAACGIASAVAVHRFAQARDDDRDDDWRWLRNIALVLGAGWFLFAESAEMWVRAGPFAVSALWAVQGAALVWVASTRRSVPPAVVGVAMQAAASIAVAVAMAADADRLSPRSFGFWADTLPVVNQYFGITLLLAACGIASAAALFRLADAHEGDLRDDERLDDWRGIQLIALVLGAGWFLFAESAEMWVRAGPFAVSALWAVQGAALLWFATRRRWLFGAICGALLQGAAGAVAATEIARRSADALAETLWSSDWALSDVLAFWADATLLANQYFGIALLLAACGVASAVTVCRSASALGTARVPLMWLALLWGVAWWLLGAGAELWVLTDSYRLWALSLLAVGTASAVVLGGRALRWRELEWAGVLMLPTLAVALVIAVAAKDYPSADWGWTAWPFMTAAYLAFLRTGGGRLGVAGLYGGLYCVASVFVAAEAYGQLAPAAEGEWPLYGAAAAVLLWLGVSLLARPYASWFVGDGWRCCLLHGITPVAWAVATGAGLAVALHHGSADPLPFVPILNPLDIAAVAAALVLLRWRHEVLAELQPDADASGGTGQLVGSNDPAGMADSGGERNSDSAGDTDRAVSSGGLTPLATSLLRLAAAPWLPTLSALGVAVLTMSAARTVHHWTDTPFELQPLVYSTELQVAVSILWAATALAAMVVAVRAADRRVWIVGASWMGVVVVKLFLIDLANLATLPKAASFIGVGILLLIVGYLAPVPPSQPKTEPPT